MKMSLPHLDACAREIEEVRDKDSCIPGMTQNPLRRDPIWQLEMITMQRLFTGHVMTVGLAVILSSIACEGVAGEREQQAQARIRVATVAMHSELGDFETNLARIAFWSAKAQGAGATFAVFPELCVTGSLCNSTMTQESARAIATKAMAIARPRLEALCAKLGMTLVVGIVDPTADRLRNGAMVIDPSGYRTTYHKLWLPNANEQKWFEAGKSLPVIESQGWKFSVGICADINYQSYFSSAAHHGAEMMLCPIGGSGRDSLVNKKTGDQTRQAEFHRNLHMKFLPARAADHGLYVFYANQAGRSGDYWYPGLALALDPSGKLVGEHRPTEGMIVTDVSRKLLQRFESRRGSSQRVQPKNSAGQAVAVKIVGARKTEDGFVSLFNGKNFNGWDIMGRKEGWAIKDGVIHSDGGQSGKWLRSKKRFKNFILKVEWKVSKGGNSGVFIRSGTDLALRPDDMLLVTGYEVQISNARRDDSHCTGALYGFVAVKPRPDESADRWHTFEIRCQDNRVTVKSDGRKCIDFDQSTNEKTRKKPLTGYIGLQDSHSPKGHYIQYRNVRIKTLQ